MAVVPEPIRRLLKKPLGAVHTTYEKVNELSKSFRIVAVGDVCTLALLAISIRPHLAVFDHRIMRKKIDKPNINVLKFAFKKMKRFKNAPGTISKDLLANAKALMREGGAVLIDGEEDLTALAFIKHADNRTVVIYGQPYVGVVVVMPNKKVKELVEGMLKQIFNKKENKKHPKTKNNKTKDKFEKNCPVRKSNRIYDRKTKS